MVLAKGFLVGIKIIYWEWGRGFIIVVRERVSPTECRGYDAGFCMYNGTSITASQ